MPYKRLTIAKGYCTAGEVPGYCFPQASIHQGENMAHFISGLMSWMRSGKVTRRNDLLTWAKTEYKKDWQFAYQYMLDHNGKAPSLRETNGPVYRKEVA